MADMAEGSCSRRRKGTSAIEDLSDEQSHLRVCLSNCLDEVKEERDMMPESTCPLRPTTRQRSPKFAYGHRKVIRRRFRRFPLALGSNIVSLALFVLLCVTHLPIAQGQGGRSRSDVLSSLTSATSSSSLTSSSPWQTVTISEGQANGTIANTSTNGNLIPDGIPVVTQLDVAAQEPIVFAMQPPFVVPANSLWISATLCSGPSIDPLTTSANASQGIYGLIHPTIPRMYVSTDSNNQKPGPDSLPNRGDGNGNTQYLVGGHAQLTLNTYGDANDFLSDGVFVSIYPPESTGNTSGIWNITILASTSRAPANVSSYAGIQFSDSDTTRALLTTTISFASNSTPPNATIYVLPTEGDFALPKSGYYNSSICAIESAFQAFNTSANSGAPMINGTITSRGSTEFIPGDDRRLQYELVGLEPSTNYTAWLVEHQQTDSTPANSTANTTFMATTLWPAIKFTTKNNENCRLVYDVSFCPQVAYSIPVGPSVSTDYALSVINETFAPNFLNFTRTVDTFPCNDRMQGNYSPVKSCDDCKRAYQDWLCSVTMPRCTDTLGSGTSSSSGTQVVTNTSSLSAAYTDVYDLTGQETSLNTQLLPYIVDRGGPEGSESRRSYINNELGVSTAYGEVLPCIYTCFFVSRSCPSPLVQWTCPLWDVSAQIDYGTFADSGQLGLGAGENGGAGTVDGQRFGGPSRYVAQDGFGKTYCNSLGVDLRLREENGAGKGSFTRTTTMTSRMLLAMTAFLSLFLFV